MGVRPLDEHPNVSAHQILNGRFAKAKSRSRSIRRRSTLEEKARDYFQAPSGLPLVQQILEQHGGSVTLADGDDGGSVVSLLLPLEESADSAAG